MLRGYRVFCYGICDFHSRRTRSFRLSDAHLREPRRKTLTRSILVRIIASGTRCADMIIAKKE